MSPCKQQGDASAKEIKLMGESRKLLSLTELCGDLKLSLERAMKKEKEERAKRSQCNWTTLGYAGADFMHSVFEIGQAIEMGRIEPRELQLQQTLEEVSSELLLIRHSLGRNIVRIEEFVASPDELEYESLEDGCFYRSAIEFFNGLFPNPANGDPEWEPLDSEDLEEYILLRANWIGPVDPKRIPPGIPSSH
ncbi:MAG: hypothetical protein SW833_19155 [Cyanobacteriota bacterium]|nr:hypothetical protein [Cyanobacteriota bacterium]